MKIKKADKIFCRNLRTVRKFLHLTQDELAHILHTTKQTVFRYEKGEASPTIDTITYLVNEFNVNLNWLLNEKCQSEEMFLKEKQDYGEFAEEINELKFLLDHVPFVRAAILKHFVLYKFDNKKEINKYLEEKGLS